MFLCLVTLNDTVEEIKLPGNIDKDDGNAEKDKGGR